MEDHLLNQLHKTTVFKIPVELLVLLDLPEFDVIHFLISFMIVAFMDAVVLWRIAAIAYTIFKNDKR